MDYIYITDKKITLSVNLRKQMDIKRLRVWYDEETNLLGLEPSETLGFKLTNEKIAMRRLPSTIEYGKYPCEWDNKQKMFIADLSKKFD